MPSRGKNSQKYSPEVRLPMNQPSIDICCGFPVSNRGNSVILMVVDHFTRWVQAIPLPNQATEACAKALFDNLFSVGLPNSILSERGKNFKTAAFRSCVTS